LKSAKLGAPFKGAKDKFFRRAKAENATARGCVKGACIEDVVDGVWECCTPWSRPLMLVTGKGVTR